MREHEHEPAGEAEVRREEEGEQAHPGLLLLQGGKEGEGDDAPGDAEAHEGRKPLQRVNLELLFIRLPFIIKLMVYRVERLH